MLIRRLRKLRSPSNLLNFLNKFACERFSTFSTSVDLSARFSTSSIHQIVQSPDSNKKPFTLRTAIALVVGNMIGAGIFTTLGIQLNVVPDPIHILILWLIGGGLAFCGAIAYSKLALEFPRSGGEFHFISRIYNQPLGFAAGAVSLLVGFAAPLALTASALGYYFQHFVNGSPLLIGITAILLFSIIHLIKVSVGAEVHFGVMLIKMALVAFFIIAGLLSVPSNINFLQVNSIESDAGSFSDLAIALLFVGFAFTGWNASCYFMDELKEAKVNVHKSLLIGTGIVTVVYIGLNITFLYVVPVEVLKGEIEIAYLAGTSIFGDVGGLIASGMIMLALLSSISSLIVAGSRVFKTMAEDYPILYILASENRGGAPANAILFQSFLAIIILLSFTFESLLTYIGFTLTIFSTLTVMGTLILQKAKPLFFLSFFQKLVIWTFLMINTVLIFYLSIEKPLTASISLFLIFCLYQIGRKIKVKQKSR